MNVSPISSVGNILPEGVENGWKIRVRTNNANSNPQKSIAFLSVRRARQGARQPLYLRSLQGAGAVQCTRWKMRFHRTVHGQRQNSHAAAPSSTEKNITSARPMRLSNGTKPTPPWSGGTRESVELSRLS